MAITINMKSLGFVKTQSASDNDYSPLIEKYSAEYNVPQSLIRGVMSTESGGNAGATSYKNAQGLMQLMPESAASLGVTDPYNPDQNIMGGTKYLRQLLDTFDNNQALALAAYHAGPGAVKKANGIPETSDGLSTTKDYVNGILNKADNFKKVIKLSDIFNKTAQSQSQQQQALTQVPVQPPNLDPQTVRTFDIPRATEQPSTTAVSADRKNEPAPLNPLELAVGVGERAIAGGLKTAAKGAVGMMTGTPGLGTLRKGGMTEEEKALGEKQKLAVKKFEEKVTDPMVQYAEQVAPMEKITDIVLKEDVPKIVRENKDFVNSWHKGSIALKVDMLGALAATTGKSEDAQKVQQLKDEFEKVAATEGEVKDKSILNKIVTSTAEMLPGLATGIPLSMIPVVGPAAGFGFWAAQGAGNTYNNLIESGVAPEKAANAALAMAPIYAGIETLQIGQIKRIPAVKTAMNGLINNAIKKVAPEYLKDVGKNVGEEFLQQVVQTVAEDIAKLPENERANFGNITKDAIMNGAQAAIQATAPTAVVSLPAKIAALFLTKGKLKLPVTSKKFDDLAKSSDEYLKTEMPKAEISAEEIEKGANQPPKIDLSAQGTPTIEGDEPPPDAAAPVVATKPEATTPPAAAPQSKPNIVPAVAQQIRPEKGTIEEILPTEKDIEDAKAEAANVEGIKFDAVINGLQNGITRGPKMQLTTPDGITFYVPIDADAKTIEMYRDKKREEFKAAEQVPQPESATPEDVTPETFHKLQPEQQIEAFKALHKKSTTDPLTGLFNRRGLELAAKKEGVTLDQNDMVIADIDKFKTVNDTHGHPVGDEVLKKFGSFLNDRLSDIAIVSRMGGEEFGIIPLQNTKRDVILDRIELARNDFSKESFANGKLTGLTFSAGYGKGLESADVQLYKAKENGRAQTWIEDGRYGQPKQPEVSVGQSSAQDELRLPVSAARPKTTTGQAAGSTSAAETRADNTSNAEGTAGATEQRLPNDAQTGGINNQVETEKARIDEQAKNIEHGHRIILDKESRISVEKAKLNAAKFVFHSIDPKSFGEAYDPHQITANARFLTNTGGQSVDAARADFVARNRGKLEDLGTSEDKLSDTNGFIQFLATIKTNEDIKAMENDVKEDSKKLNKQIKENNAALDDYYSKNPDAFAKEQQVTSDEDIPFKRTAKSEATQQAIEFTKDEATQEPTTQEQAKPSLPTQKFSTETADLFAGTEHAETRTQEQIESDRKRQAEHGEIAYRQAQPNGGSAMTEDLPLFAESSGQQSLQLQKVESPVKKEGTVDAVQSYVNEDHAGIKNKIVVVQGDTNLPEQHINEIRRQGAQGQVAAVYDNKTGTIYLVAGNLPSRQATTKAVMHELFHAGARNLLSTQKGKLGTKLHDTYISMYNSLAPEKRQEIIDNYFPNGFNAENNSHKFKLVDEVLAARSETAIDPTLLQKFLSLVRAALRKLGVVSNWSDGELLNFISKARKAGIRTEGNGAEGVAAQIKAYHGTGHEIKQFGDKPLGEVIGTGEGAQSFGYGLYFTNSKDIAKHYAKKLSGSDSKDNTYEVTLHKGKSPDEYEYIKWDEPVTDNQLQRIKTVFVEHANQEGSFNDGEQIFDNLQLNGSAGEGLYRTLSNAIGGDKSASEMLLASGIDGVDYPAGTISGSAKDGDRNYVVFDPKTVSIDAVNDQKIEEEYPFKKVLKPIKINESDPTVKKVKDVFDKSDKKLKVMQKRKFSKLKDELSSGLYDRFAPIKGRLVDKVDIENFNTPEAQAAVKIDLMAGARGESQRQYKAAEHSIAKILGNIEADKFFGRYLALKRIIEIDKLMEKQGRKNTQTGNIDAATAQKFLDEFNKLNPDIAADMETAAQQFWNVNKVAVNRLFEKGLIDEKMRDYLINEHKHYFRKKYLNHIDPDGTTSFTNSGSKISTNDSGIVPLQEGSDESILTDWRALLGDTIIRVETRIARNEANKALYEVAKNNPDNELGIKIENYGKEKQWLLPYVFFAVCFFPIHS